MEANGKKCECLTPPLTVCLRVLTLKHSKGPVHRLPLSSPGRKYNVRLKTTTFICILYVARETNPLIYTFLQLIQRVSNSFLHNLQKDLEKREKFIN